MSEVVILSAARTPIGAFQGAFRDVAGPEAGRARDLAGACERAGVGPVRSRAGLHGLRAARRHRPGAGPPGDARRRLPAVDRRDHLQQGLRLGRCGP